MALALNVAYNHHLEIQLAREALNAADGKFYVKQPDELSITIDNVSCLGVTGDSFSDLLANTGITEGTFSFLKY